MVLRRAKALAHYLDNRKIYMLPNERIVGNIAGQPNAVITFPELWYRWLDKALDEQFRPLLDDNEREELHQIHKYWSSRAVHGSERALLPEEVLPYWFYNNHGVFRWLHGGHVGTPNYPKLFNIGLKGIVEEAKTRLNEISTNQDFYLNHAEEYLNRKAFYEAVIIVTEAVSRQGKRFSQLATEMAKEEKDEKRKAELEEIAQICDWVPENPPRSLHEALQFYWLVNLVARIVDIQSSGYGERLDQIFYPFYEKGKQEGKLTREQAQELVEHLFLKCNEEGDLVPPGLVPGGPIVTRVTTVGGQTRDGADATNEMTYIIMDAKNEMGLTQPAIAVRLHRRTPQQLMHQIVKSLLKRPGVYSFFNDEMMIPFLLNHGIPLEDARKYTTDGCMRWEIPGKAITYRALGGFFILPTCLQLALSQGYHRLLDKQIGPKTADPGTFKSIEDLIKAYFDQLRFFLGKLCTIYNIVDVLDKRWLPQPFLSATLDGCLDRGQDCREYKYFPNTILQPIGQINVVNSLAAVKKLVFDDKQVSMAELVDALDNNWEGKEELRQKFINAPKFGNDDDYVDLLARDIFSQTTRVIESFKNIYGGPFMEDGTGASTYFMFSGLTAATPDGRKDLDLFNDGTVSPAIGTDKKGPTAILKSVGKIDHAGTGTQLLNQKFIPAQLKHNEGETFISYMRTFVDLGIHHIQFNVIDKETLLDAQEHPEKYGDLVIRVAGYAAYFVDLAKEMQDQIIARTEQPFA